MSEQVIISAREIGKSICRRRQELGLTQEALAELIEVSCQQLQRYEYGKNKLNIENLQRIAKALDVPTAYFFPDNKQP
jgi:transcriptional regulator with XRE-family HTH domain